MPVIEFFRESQIFVKASRRQSRMRAGARSGRPLPPTVPGFIFAGGLPHCVRRRSPRLHRRHWRWRDWFNNRGNPGKLGGAVSHFPLFQASHFPARTREQAARLVFNRKSGASMSVPPGKTFISPLFKAQLAAAGPGAVADVAPARVSRSRDSRRAPRQRDRRRQHCE
jgi:hypothetical protein